MVIRNFINANTLTPWLCVCVRVRAHLCEHLCVSYSTFLICRVTAVSSSQPQAPLFHLLIFILTLFCFFPPHWSLHLCLSLSLTFFFYFFLSQFPLSFYSPPSSTGAFPLFTFWISFLSSPQEYSHSLTPFWFLLYLFFSLRLVSSFLHLIFSSICVEFVLTFNPELTEIQLWFI